MTHTPPKSVERIVCERYQNKHGSFLLEEQIKERNFIISIAEEAVSSALADREQYIIGMIEARKIDFKWNEWDLSSEFGPCIECTECGAFKDDPEYGHLCEIKNKDIDDILALITPTL